MPNNVVNESQHVSSCVSKLHGLNNLLTFARAVYVLFNSPDTHRENERLSIKTMICFVLLEEERERKYSEKSIISHSFLLGVQSLMNRKETQAQTTA